MLVMRLVLDTQELRDENGASVHIRAKALDLLCLLARHKDSVVSRDAVFNEIWPERVVTDDSIFQCVNVIRKVLKDHDRSLIETIPKRGYRLNSTATARLQILPSAQSIADQGDKRHEAATARFATSPNGTRLAYAINGSGPVLLRTPHWMTHVVHEWNDCVFGPRLRCFAEELTIMRYDGRGFGLSERSGGCGEPGDWVSDMQAVVEAAQLQRFAVTGNSGGAPLALRYAATYPDKISCLVILGGFMKGGLKRGVSPAHVHAFTELIRNGWAGKNPAFRQMMSTQLFPQATPEQLEAFDALQKKASDGKTAASLMSKLATIDISEYLPRIRVPTLILHSEHDERQPFEQAIEMANLIPNAELHVMQTRNHVPPMHEPEFERILRVTIDFVKKHSV